MYACVCVYIYIYIYVHIYVYTSKYGIYKSPASLKWSKPSKVPRHSNGYEGYTMVIQGA